MCGYNTWVCIEKDVEKIFAKWKLDVCKHNWKKEVSDFFEEVFNRLLGVQMGRARGEECNNY